MQPGKSFLSLTLIAASLCAVTVERAAAEPVGRLPRVDIIGSAIESLERTPGSAEIITREELEVSQPLSTQDALSRVTGINVVETEGYGFFPRIGIRGLNPDMSKKVLLLEDGAPVALGPYTDPAAYYSPPIERMERIEVLKGSGSLRYGPSTIGGAINYITKDPPFEPGGSVSLSGGNRGYWSTLAEYGGTWGNAMGSISYLHKEGDGTRTNNDFRIDDVLIKAGFGIGDNQFVGAKFSYYDQDSQSTYMGLTQREFRENPRQNQAKNDRIDVERYALDLTHEIQFTPDITWRNLAFFNNTTRDWWREGFSFNPATGLNEMSGRTSGRLREFTVKGIDSRLELAYEVYGLRNEADFGVRFHTEEMINKRVDGPVGVPTARSGTIRQDDKREADAIAVFLQNRLHVTERFAITPGMRVESYRQKRKIYRWDNLDVNERGKSRNTEWVPGVGATYAFHEGAILFAGVHRGFAPPRVADAIDNDAEAIDLSAERSVNYELGMRGTLPFLSYEITGFRYDFTNQIVQASQAGGATSELTNAGKTLNEGVELGVDFKLPWGFGLDVNWTHVATARLDSTRILGGIDRKGNRLPYAPRNLLNTTLNYRQGPFRAALQYSHVGAQYSDFENTREGSPDGRTGRIPSFGVWNLSGDYQLTSSIALHASIKNLFDKDYIASRAPQGIFPGAPRLIMGGARVSF